MTSCFEDVAARDAPRVLGALVRRYGSVADCKAAVHAHLLSMAGEREWADSFFLSAATLATSAPEQRCLLKMARRQ